MAKKTAADQGPKDPARKLRKLLKRPRVAMLTTIAPDGSFRSRPMLPGILDEGVLSFLTSAQSEKALDIADNQRVHLTYVSRKSDSYVAISGVASLSRDPGHVRDLWDKEHKDWFPEGKNDPELAVLRVTIDRVDYWDPQQGRMVSLIEGRPEGAGPGGGGPPPVDQPVSSGALG